jgi:hypothetical protein
MADNTSTHVRKVGGKAKKDSNEKFETILFYVLQVFDLLPMHQIH